MRGMKFLYGVAAALLLSAVAHGSMAQSNSPQDSKAQFVMKLATATLNDGQYEWMWSTLSLQSGSLDKTVSAALKEQFATYQSSLALSGVNGYGTLSSDNYSAYMMKE